ncbi:MAG TPA: ABC transporter ATP-binding protein [Polyangiaceae bacterium]|nr:ABC transporter ATP-binding protein [Polyangiaceae bacterium]
MTEPLLAVRALVVRYETEAGTVRAVDGVDLDVGVGETLALVGESGCGKSTVARAIVGIAPKTSGSIRFSGTELPPLGTARRRPFLPRLQMVFQDPDASLDPRYTVGASIDEPLQLADPKPPRGERTRRVAALLEDVGLDETFAVRYPHELSGGQKQRVCLARALATNPSLLVCDEAVSALDVSIQAQILNLLRELQERRGLAYLFITHDLRVVRHVSDRVAVMYLGQIVETAPTEELFASPAHPYTEALLAAVPSLSKRGDRTLPVVRGEIPSPLRPPAGCRFHTRCPRAFDRCPRESPPLYPKGPVETRCFLAAPE